MNFPEELTLIGRLQRYIRNGDLVGLFTKGACWHFARIAHQLNVGELACTETRDPSDGVVSVDHAFVICKDSDLVFDCQGWATVEEMVQRRGVEGFRRTMQPEEVDLRIARMELPPDLREEIEQLALTEVRRLKPRI